MEAVDWRPADVPLVVACRAIGLSRATLYRSRRPRPVRELAARPPSPRRLSDDERRVVVETLTSSEFADQPPAEVYATLLGRGVYLASIRTMYRLLALHFGVIPDRRAQRLVRHHAAPSLEATLPNQVWTWDITKLAGPERGVCRDR
jgi:putative transposase